MGVDEQDELFFVWCALERLAHTDIVWRKNYAIFFELPLDKRRVWWAFAKQQDLPMYQTLKLKVIELRMNQ